MAFGAVAKPGTTAGAGLGGAMGAPRDPETLRKMLAGELAASDSFRGPTVNKSAAASTAAPGAASGGGSTNAGTPANQADFLGEGTNGGVNAPPPRPTDPTGLYYRDTGEPTPLYHQRKQMASGVVTPGSALGQQYLAAEDRRIWSPTPEQRADGWAMDPSSGLFTKDFGNGDRVSIGNDPSGVGQQPAYTVANTPDGLRVGPGAALPGDNGQRLATQAEADRANQNIVATGESHPGGGMNPTITPGSPQDLAGLSAAGQQRYDQLGRQRRTDATNMYDQGFGALGRDAPQASFVDYGKPQNIATTPGATVGNFGAQQNVAAPSLAAARDAAVGNFGAQQSVRAANVAPAVQARNAAGFLAGTADQARSISDLDFALADESRGAMGESINRIRAYVDQGPGESAAAAQLRQAQEQSLGDALSLARSGRGNAAGNMKMALSENAATNAQTNLQAAQLRAEEADAWRSRQLQGLGLEQSGTQAMRGQDITQATAAGQHAVSREQIASNVDVSRAGLEQQLGIANAEQSNLGNRLQAQLSTDAAIQQASLANARNIAQGQAGTQVNLSNAEQTNLMNRTRAQQALDAATTTANLANQRNIAVGQAGTQTSISNADNAAARARANAELANQLAIAQGNSRTDITGRNLDASVTTAANNDRLMSELYGYGVDLGRQELDALGGGTGTAYDYASLVSNNEQRGLDRAAGIDTASADRKQKKEAAVISALAASLGAIL